MSAFSDTGMMFSALSILAVGVILSLRTRFVQVRKLNKAFKYLFLPEDGDGQISGFGALCTSLSATIGTGNIIGVATAVKLGGAGALFWMAVAGFFGMATKYAEGMLAVKYRVKNPDGTVSGGPFYYIERGICPRYSRKFGILARLFAFFCMSAGLLGIGTLTQSNGIADAVDRITDSRVLFNLCGRQITLSAAVVSVTVTVCAMLIIKGGTKSIARASEIIVPFMSAAYVLLMLFVIAVNYRNLPSAFSQIIKGAFTLRSAGGAASGVGFCAAIKYGVTRGVFSNEAGLGSAAIAAAQARSGDSVRQGLVTMTGTFIDTLVICMMTGLAVICTSSANGSAEGFNITANALLSLPFSYRVCEILLCVCLIFFAFTTVVGWNFYSEKCFEYLCGGETRLMPVFRLVYMAAVAAGPFLNTAAAWGIADVCNLLAVFPNLIALVILTGKKFSSGE